MGVIVIVWNRYPRIFLTVLSIPAFYGKMKLIYLEMCYSGNLQTKTVGRAEDDPFVRFLADGIGVTLNTDSLTVSNTALRREYALVQQMLTKYKSILPITLLCIRWKWSISATSGLHTILER